MDLDDGVTPEFLQRKTSPRTGAAVGLRVVDDRFSDSQCNNTVPRAAIVVVPDFFTPFGGLGRPPYDGYYPIVAADGLRVGIPGTAGLTTTGLAITGELLGTHDQGAQMINGGADDPDRENTDNHLSDNQDSSIGNRDALRCVCGQVVQAGLPSDNCPQCGRKYDREFLNAVSADTISVDSDLSSPRLRVDPDNDPLIGQQLGHFTILSRIGDGGMGAVYYALDESLQRHVAIKVISNESGEEDSADLDRLFQEARAQARVNHPNVVHVYYVGKEGDTPFLAMEHVGNGTLADRMREGPIAFPDIVRYAIQITRALGCAAEYDIVHGDIKPSNVLLVDDTSVKLSDFGLARRLSAGSELSAKVSGTPDYMPPEVTLGRGVDHRGDVYSLGVTLFQMTFGRLPYTASGTTPSARLRLHREAPVEFPDIWPTELPEEWKFLLARLLSKDPRGRPADFVDLEKILQSVAPNQVAIANPILRGLAWVLDGGLLVAAMVVVHAAVGSAVAMLNPEIQMVQSGLPQLGWIGSLLNTGIDILLLIAVGLLQAHWGNTTGKRLLQILIVDQHGLKPSRRVLAARTAFQFSWVWWWFVIRVPLESLSLGGLSDTIGWVVGAMLIVEAGSVLLRQGRSVHDSIFGTRVVLDAAPESTTGDL